MTEIRSCPRFSVVIVAYHRPGDLARLLDALAPTDDSTLTRVVVVNVDDDPVVRSVAVAHADVVELSASNLGYAAAVNAGVALVNDEFVVFMNDDVHVDHTDLVRLVGRVACGATDVAVPRLVDEYGDDEGTVRALPTPGRLLVEWALTSDQPHRHPRSVEKWRRPTAPEAVSAATAALVAVRTDLLREHPLPDAYFLYWEELDWFWQLRETGARVEIVPDVTVKHAGGREDVRPDKQRLLARNAVRCVRLTQGRQAALLAWPIVVAWQARLVTADAWRCVRSPRARGRFTARVAGLGAAVGAWREIA